ncbi:MAG TPA: peptidylprolyl isomerase [Caulobacteraceae bacterium]|jgi:peptidyl-prolyl cis-trans isomerase C
MRLGRPRRADARTGFALPALALCLMLAACGRGGGDAPLGRGDRAAAKVGDDTVYVSDVRREAIAQDLLREGEPLDPTSDLFKRVLDEVVDQKLLAREAERRGLANSAAAKRRLQAARERILGDMLVENVVEGAVNEDAVKALYKDQQRLSKQSEEVRARQIVSATPEQAQAVMRLLGAGGDFAQLAMDRSTDQATRFNGGDLGYFTFDVMPDAYEAALKTARAGQVVGPFRTEAGWVIVRVEDRRPEQPLTLDEARPQIVRFLTYDRIRQLLEDLRARAEVDYLIGRGDAPSRPQEPASAPLTTPPPVRR